MNDYPRAMRLSFLTMLFLPVVFLTGCDRQQPPSPPPPPPEVATVTVQLQAVPLTSELPGRTAAYRVAEIRPQINGLIKERLFTEGADVQAGDVLYQIDAASYQAAFENAQAALAGAKAKLLAIRLRADRYRELLAKKAVSQQAYDDALAALNQAEADVQYWTASVQTARINLNYTRITAPISGRIGRSTVTEGAIVTAYQPVALATIQQLDPIYVDVPQATTELLRLRRRLSDGRLDQSEEDSKSAGLLLADGSRYPLAGTLKFRDITVDPGTGSVSLRVLFPNPDGVLLPGMFVRALIQEGVDSQAMLIPQQTITRDPKGNPVALIVDTDNMVQQRQLVLERAVADQWLVASGLAPGDQVIVEGVQKVRPGMPVRTVPFAADAAAGDEAGTDNTSDASSSN